MEEALPALAETDILQEKNSKNWILPGNLRVNICFETSQIPELLV